MKEQGNLEYGEILIYDAGDSRVEVRLDRESVWLTLNQLAELFGRDKSVVSRHLRNIFFTGELARNAVVAKNATTALDGKTYQVDFYNLDAIISVGYRVNSKRGTQFRIWATSVLRDHFVKGYSLNQKRLAEKGLAEMEQTIALLARTLVRHEELSDEGRAVLEVVSRYAKTWSLLLQYDENRLGLPKDRQDVGKSLDYQKVKTAIAALKAELCERGESGDLFGQERGQHLNGILGNLDQTFGGQDLYASVEEKAAHLLYFVINVAKGRS
ncbi:MAG: virulence RhuM family protein [Desulfobulbaceae bacterium]|nr:virulence RhuM family protein [Desulfobulbaceae bacterium]